MPRISVRAATRALSLAGLTLLASACATDREPYGGPIGTACAVASAPGALYVTTELPVGFVPVSVVRRIDLRTGAISTIAGAARRGVAANGAPAAKAALGEVCGVAVDTSGDVLVPDSSYAEHGQLFGHNRVRVIAASSGMAFGRWVLAGDVYTLAGGLHRGFSGDGGPADRALLAQPSGLGVDAAGNVIIADSRNSRIRVIAQRSGTYFGRQMRAGDIYTIAGNGQLGYLGDGVPGARAVLDIGFLGGGAQTDTPLAVDAAGNVLFGDTYHGDGRVRLVAASTGFFYGRRMRAGYVYTVAGGGGRYLLYGQLGHGGKSVGSGLSRICGVAVDGSGNLLLATPYQIWVAAQRTGVFYGQEMRAGHIYHLAGLPAAASRPIPPGGRPGDGGPAARAAFALVGGLAVDAAGNVVVVDQTRVRVIVARSGTFYGQPMTRGDIYTVAGVFARF